jgi:diguanylate cyclase (GGDEF)-like protein
MIPTLDQMESLLRSLQNKQPLEESLSKIVREIDSTFDFQSMGIFLKVPDSEIYRLKIGRNISHTFSKTTIFTTGDQMMSDLSHFTPLDIIPPGVYIMEHDYSHLLIHPLFYTDVLFGFVFIDKEEGLFGEDDMRRFHTFSSLISLIVNIYHQKAEIDSHRDLIERTRVYNYKPFMSRAELMFSLMRRYQRDLTVCVLKIDNYENLQRLVGKNKTGDIVQHIVNVFQRSMRSSDLVGRIYKDMFAVFMPETTIKNCHTIVERLQLQILNDKLMSNSILGWGIVQDNEEMKSVSQFIHLGEKAAFESARNDGILTDYHE